MLNTCLITYNFNFYLVNMNNLRNLLYRSKCITKHLRYYSKDLYEPDYLELLKSKIPLYDLLNIQLRGYDYPVLESFQKSVHSLAKNMDVDVEDSWACPAQDMQIVNYKPKSDVINAQYNLKIYERTVQIVNISSLQLSILLRVLEASTPAGITVDVVPHQDDHDEVRYVPDLELLNLKQQLEDMGGPRKK